MESVIIDADMTSDDQAVLIPRDKIHAMHGLPDTRQTVLVRRVEEQRRRGNEEVMEGERSQRKNTKDGSRGGKGEGSGVME